MSPLSVSIFERYISHFGEEPPEADISVRIEEIADQLAGSSKELSDLQKELENRIATVEDLKREAEIAESVISLTDEQVRAIQAKLNQELEASSGKSLWQNILVSAVFFLLGFLIRPAIDLVKRFANRGKQPSEPKFGGYTQEELERAVDLLNALNNREKDGQ